MADKIIKAWGPRTASVERSAALEQLQSAPGFPKGAIIHDFREEDGRWLAEIKVAETKEAAPPFPPKDVPTDDEAPDSKPPSEDAPAEPESDDSDEPKEEKEPKGEDEKPKDEGKKSVEDILQDLAPIIHQIADKLGIGAPGDDSPVPGEDGPLGDVPPPPDAPPAPPTKGPGGGGLAGLHGPSKLKPGEMPNRPGVTPVGAPAFSSTQASTVPDDHPWKDLIGKVASITVSEPTDVPLKEAHAELKSLAEPYGYHVRRLREDTEDGTRVVRALISRR